MKTLISIIRTASDWMKWPAAFLVVSMTILINVEVIARYFFRHPLNIGIAYSEIAQALMTGLAASWVLIEDKHVCVDVVLALSSERMRNILKIVNSILGVVFCGVFSWTAWIMTLRTYRMGEHTETLDWPLTPIAVLFSLGFCLFTVAFLGRAIEAYMALRKGEAYMALRKGNEGGENID